MVFGPVPEAVVVTVPEPVPELLPEFGAAEELEDEPDEFQLTLDEPEELPLTLDELEELPLTAEELDDPDELPPAAGELDEPDELPPAADELDEPEEPEGSPPAVDELDEPEELPLTAVELEVLDEPAADPEAVPEFPADGSPDGFEADELPEDVVTGVVLMESTSPKLFPGCVFEVICEFLATCLPRSISDAPPSAEFPLALPWVLTGVLFPS